MNNMMFDKAIQEFLSATKYGEARTVGANSFIAYYNAGVVEECLGHKGKALEYYTKAGNYEKAKKRIECIK